MWKAAKNKMKGKGKTYVDWFGPKDLEHDCGHWRGLFVSRNTLVLRLIEAIFMIMEEGNERTRNLPMARPQDPGTLPFLQSSHFGWSDPYCNVRIKSEDDNDDS
jgi:hypothetical protein